MICKRNLQFSGSISIKSGQRQDYSDQELSGAISKSFIVKVAPVFTFSFYLFIYLFIYLFYFPNSGPSKILLNRSFELNYST